MFKALPPSNSQGNLSLRIKFIAPSSWFCNGWGDNGVCYQASLSVIETPVIAY